MEHKGKATSFADPEDVKAFEKAKAKGMSDSEAFKYGDNGIGCWGDKTSEGSGMACAVPPDKMESKWGSIKAAKHKKILITTNHKTVTSILKDRMPWEKNIHNGAVIDMNPDTCKALGLKPPVSVNASWSWAA
jgi:hypothetical protein